MKCIVTGGCGFIGSHVVDRLIQKKMDVTVIDNCSSAGKNFYFNEKVTYVNTDISTDPTKISKWFNDVDYVFHLAAVSRFGASIDDPIKTYNTNCIGTLNILQLCASNRIKKVIFSSTSVVPFMSKITECFNVPYIVTKNIGEGLCDTYRKVYNLNVYVLRYFSVYGERQPTEGIHAPVVGKLMKEYDEGKKIVVTSAKRDFVHVSDVAHATVKCADHDVGIVTNPIDIGTGESVLISDIAKAVCQDKNKEFDKINRKKFDVDETKADLTLAKKHLKFKPSVNVLDWIKEQAKKI